MTLVKICGLCDVAGARAAVAAGADLLGFHFCDSARRVAPEEALEIVTALEMRPSPTRGGRWRASAAGGPPRLVGVFIDSSEDEVDRVARHVGLDVVQLHGSEPAGFRCRRPLLKALKVRDGTVPDADAWPDPILLDSWSPDQRGGTGRTWDWRAARSLMERRRVIVAGGLGPANVGEVVRTFRPHGVDVSSGVERAVRVKDGDLIRAFVQAVRDADLEMSEA